jgi:hypothetical protein
LDVLPDAERGAIFGTSSRATLSIEILQDADDFRDAPDSRP